MRALLATLLGAGLVVAVASAGEAEAPRPATRPAAGSGPATRPAALQDAEGLQKSLRGLQLEGLAPPETVASARLRAAMEALRNVQVVPRARGRTAAKVLAARRAAQAMGGATTRPAAPAGKPKHAATQPAAPAPGLSQEVLKQLKALPAAGLSRPGEIADELYSSGLTEAAYALYEHTLTQTQDPNAQGWALYQMANCRRPTDPAAAAMLYGRVVSEHGTCLWAQVAEVERKLVVWQEANRPLALLKSIKSVGEILRRSAGSRSAATQPAATQPTTQPATTRPVSEGRGAVTPSGTK